MATYKAWVIHRHYYRVVIEADSIEEADDLAWEVDVNGREPDDVDVEIYDVEEVKDNG